MDILDELFAGKFDPIGESPEQGKKIQTLRKQESELEKQMKKGLTEEQCILMDRLGDIKNAIFAESERNGFRWGFRCSTQLIKAGLHPEIDFNTKK